MEEEKKEEEKKGCVKATFKTLLKICLGILLIAVGIVGIWRWRWDVLILIKGCLGIVFVFAGLICLAIAKE